MLKFILFVAALIARSAAESAARERTHAER